MLNALQLNRIQDITSELTNRLKLNTYPLSMKNVILENYRDNIILGCIPFRGNVDAVTEYDSKSKLYVITVNRNRIAPNLLKRLNFTLAHELGHIILNHEPMFKNALLTPQEETFYEHEADEFAGQLLMPEDELSFMPKNLKLISEYFYVSEHAALKRLQMIEKRKVLYSNHLRSNVSYISEDTLENLFFSSRKY